MPKSRPGRLKRGRRPMLRKLPALLLCAVWLTALGSSALAVEFPGRSDEPWSREEVDLAAGQGLDRGLPGGAFQPEAALDRATCLSMLQQMLGWAPVTPETPSYADVSPEDWFYSAVETARANGALPEEGERFHPLGYVSGEDLAALLVRALGYEALAQDVAEDSDLTGRAGHLALAASFGLTADGGEPSQPGAFLTQGQAAAMLGRVCQRYRAGLEWLNGFYAFASYDQIGYTDWMDAVSVGWARLSWDSEGGPWINSTAELRNEWVKPRDYETAASYFRGNGTPCSLNVYADTRQSVTLADGSATSVLELVLPDPERRAAAVAAIAAAAPEYAGITIDFEGLRTDLLREDFVAFLTELRSALPPDKTLYVCVPPDDWYKGYDFRALGEICDKIIYMVHDYQWTRVPDGALGRPIGTDRDNSSPVTPFDSVYRALASITDPVTGVRDRSKIALQISFGSAGFRVSETGYLVENAIYHPAQDTIARRLMQPDTVVTYDEHDRNPMMRYSGDEGSRYVLWYEDARSVADKIELARLFGITGISIWRLGNIPSDPVAPHYDVWGTIQAMRESAPPAEGS